MERVSCYHNVMDVVYSVQVVTERAVSPQRVIEHEMEKCTFSYISGSHKELSLPLWNYSLPSL